MATKLQYYQRRIRELPSRVQKFPFWHTKAAPNGKCREGYTVWSMSYWFTDWIVCWNKGRLCWEIAKLFYFCHLKKLVRPETFGPYYLHASRAKGLQTAVDKRLSSAKKVFRYFHWHMLMRRWTKHMITYPTCFGWEHTHDTVRDT